MKSSLKYIPVFPKLAAISRQNGFAIYPIMDHNRAVSNSITSLIATMPDLMPSIKTIGGIIFLIMPPTGDVDGTIGEIDVTTKDVEGTTNYVEALQEMLKPLQEMLKSLHFMLINLQTKLKALLMMMNAIHFM